MIIHFEIPGKIQPKQRTGGFNHYTKKETRDFEKLVGTIAKTAMRGQPPIIGYLSVLIDITVKIPKSFTKKKRELALNYKLFPTFCDVDNQIKALLDGMNNIVYVDDSYINSISASRAYGNEEKAIVTVKELV